MSDPQGRILDVLRASDGVRVVIEVEAEAVCARCAEGRGCGAGVFSGATKVRRLEASVPQGLEVESGDIVRLSLAPEHLLRAASIVYGLPLTGAAAGATAAYALGLGDAGAAILALSGVAAGLWVGRRRLQRKECLATFTPTVVGRVAASGQPY
jgi:sigma-E factor negative regulatory protein RseC